MADYFGVRPLRSAQIAEAGTLVDAICASDDLWHEPRPGQLQPGLTAIFGGRPPVSLAGVQLWPVAVSARSGPALVLTDIRRHTHVVVDVAAAPVQRSPRPGWVPAARVALAPRLAGSAELWRYWAAEIADHAPHDWDSACDEHQHLARPTAQGQLVTGIPQHDAWQMTRSWVPAEQETPSIADVHWVVLTASDRLLREREREIHSRWESVSFAEFALAFTAPYRQTGLLPAGLATILRLLLPPVIEPSEAT